MNENAAALAELGTQEQQSLLARSPEADDIEKFDAILDESMSVEAVNLDSAQVDAVSRDNHAALDPVNKVGEQPPLDALMPQSYQHVPYAYQAAEQNSGNSIVTKFTQSLAGLGDRQESISSKLSDELYGESPMSSFFSESSPKLNRQFEFMWDLQQTQMEVQRWTVEVNLLTTSVSKSTSGVQTLFRSSG